MPYAGLFKSDQLLPETTAGVIQTWGGNPAQGNAIKIYFTLLNWDGDGFVQLAPPSGFGCVGLAGGRLWPGLEAFTFRHAAKYSS